MKFPDIRWIAATAVLTVLAVFDSTSALAQSIPISENPLFSVAAQPPLNMLVVGKDTKLYYEAYNDASDIDGDGALDIGYKPDRITYYGYFNSNVCYTWSTDRFVPTSATANKQCSGTWSGDFLNYATTARMDALRRVLYGGWRQVDTATDTVLQGAYFPQDGHSAGKEYQSIARDGYDISKYTPYPVPGPNRYILFATTTVTGNDNAYPNYQAPMLRVLKNTDKRVWNWLSIEGPVAGNKCFTTANTRVDCVTVAGSNWDVLPTAFYSGLTISTWNRTDSSGGSSPSNKAGMDTLFANNAIAGNLCGSGPVANINTTGANNNPFAGTNGCTQDNYLTLIKGTLSIPTTQDYVLSIDGDDAVDVFIDGVATPLLSWYGGHGSDRSTAGLDGRSIVKNLTAGDHQIAFRHQEGTGSDSWGFLSRTDVPAATRDDFYVRVQSCPASNAALREASCKLYPNGQYKPTGILHDYGETGKMFFGLIGGSQANNLEGGVLRRNVTNFSDEIDANTGVFKTTVNGIANSLSGLRMIGGGYNSGVTDNLNSDTNWNWANGTGNCPSIGDRAINNGECRMWGNPIAEMMYETLRYFAGAAAPTTRFSSTSSPGSAEDVTMNLHTETWRNPYGTVASGGSGYLSCSKPFETVISDINPSYDGDLPGSPFTGAVTTTNNTPATITGFNAATEGQLIWNAEFGGPKKVFIGESNGVTDGAPTSKQATSFGNIRGLSPEEPTKGGTYYAASVARFGRNNDINAVAGQQNMSTYSIALASQLPHIEFPVGTAKVTLIPFAKTLSGTFGGGTRKPTNTIVDYYVERIVNLPGQPVDLSPTGNNGLPYAVFRINYEDVEQGNDHDMDAIVRYVIKANTDNTVTVRLESEYAAGSANQDMGYVMSGTSQDGLYVEVADTDSTDASYHALKTPNPVLPGGCAPATHPAACDVKLPLVSERIFTPNAAASDAISLNDPLWYAAKYGAPDPTANDLDNNGVPDNYFLVTNPTNLRSQLDKAFTSILGNSVPVGSASASNQRFVANGSLAYQASFLITDWTGDLKAFALNSDGSLSATPTWSASNRPTLNPAVRKIFTSKLASGAFTGIPFKVADLTAAGLNVTLMSTLNTAVYNITDVVAYLLGDQTKETNQIPAGPYRTRTTKIGDILDSTPTVKFREGYGYQNLPAAVNSRATGSATYQAFVTAKPLAPVVFVGANDGILHAFDGSAASSGGSELFGYIPNSVIGKLNRLVQPAYAHTYYVDGTPRLGDIYDGAWKTLLIGTTGAGARSVFGLDVTNPSSFGASNVLWEFNDQLDADMGFSVGIPSLPTITSDGLWVTAFGNGYNSARNRAELFILDAKTGNKLSEIDTGVGGNSTSVNCIRATGPNDCPNGLSSAVMIDSDLDGTGDTIYAGDYLGNMWKFTCTPDTIALTVTHPAHLCTSPWKVGLGGVPLIKAQDSTGLRQPITSGVYAINNPLGGTIVYFGTGRYLTVDDANPASSTLVNSIYAVWDNPNNTGTTLTRADLQQQTITSYNASTGFVGVSSSLFDYDPVFPPTATTSKMGWFMDLVSPTGSDPMTSERVIAAPSGILGSLLVNAFRPTGDVCLPGGKNTFFELNLLNGSAAYSILPGGSGTVPPTGTGGSDVGNGSPLGSPSPVISIPGQPGIPSIGCPPGNPSCATANPAYCTPGVAGYPNCAAPCWCHDAATCTIAEAPVGCAAGSEPAFPYGGMCKCASEQCKWFNPGTPVGNLVACRISWRQLR